MEKVKEFMKKRLWKNFFLVIVPVIIMTTMFMACSKKEIKKDKKVSVKNTQNEYVYHPTFQNININVDYISGICRKNKKIYILATKEIENKKYGSRQSQYFISCTEDGSDLQQTRLRELKGNESVIVFAIDEQNQLRLLTQQYEYSEKTQESKQVFYIYTLNEKGKIKDIIKLKTKQSKYEQEYFYRNSRNTVTFSNGKLYTAVGKKIYTFDKKGEEGETYETEGDIDGFIRTVKGEIYIYGNIGSKYGLRKFDSETGKFSDIINFKEYQIYNARIYVGEGNTVYVDDQNNIYTFDLLSGKLKIEFNWLNNNIDGNNIIDCIPLEEEKFLVIDSSYDDGQQKNVTNFIMVNKVKASDIKEKKIIKLSSFSLDDNIKRKILYFNKTNENYQIEVEDYSVYGDGESRLNLDIASGNIPDILDVSKGVFRELLIKKGVFTDLYSLMENDGEVRKEVFIPSVLKTLETDGKLFYLSPYFNIEGGFIAGKKMVGDIEGCSMDDMIKLYEDMSEDTVFMQSMTKQWFIQDIISHQMGEYINWSTGEVKFNSDDFIKLIEFSNHFPDEEDMFENEESMPILVKKGRLILERWGLCRAEGIDMYTDLYKKQGGYTILSYPSANKSNKLSMCLEGGALAITEQCDNKEGAWEFIRQFFTYDYQKSKSSNNSFLINGFPTRQDALDKELEYAQATKAYTDDDGTKVEPISFNYSYGGYNITFGPVSDEEVEVIRSVIKRVGICVSYGDKVTKDVIKIINEEVEAFFAGDKSAEETANIIQNRVKTYVSESL